MDAPPRLAVELSGLTRRFKSLTAVDRLSFEVLPKSIFGLLGSNGAGKTTVIKMLTTLLPPSAGTASVAGFDIAREPKEVRRHIGYVSQMLSSDGELTGYENLVISAKLYGLTGPERRKRIEQSLAFMELTDAAGRLVVHYSGGMIRRLEIAQSMLHRPAVLFLDEPTIGLDPVARRVVWDRLKDLKHDYGMTVLITTHDMEEADILCDELAILCQGKIAATGSPVDLKSAVSSTATMEDVFACFAGGQITEGGTYRDVRRTRSTATRLG